MSPPPTELDRTAVTGAEWLPGYEVLSAVGVGGFGTVFKARHLRLDRMVAVKVIHTDQLGNPAVAARFEAEAVALARCQHPNVVQVYDTGESAGRVFIAMELLEGEDLGQRLERAGPLDERTAWAVARQAAAGLAHAAARGLVHRDVKPANLFLVPPPAGAGADVPVVKVTDFGLARARWAAAADGRQTPSGVMVGTPLYMAPEQFRGEADLDHRADIYALGATVYHALTGHRPFDGSTPWDVLARKLTPLPRLGPAVSPGTADLVAAMTAPDPADRVATYDELIARIDRLTAGGVTADPAPRRSPRGRWSRRRRAWAAAAAGVVALGGLTVGLRPSPDRSPPLYVSTGAQLALFDGKAGWLPPAAGGTWQVDADDEGAVVLSGTGYTRRAFTATGDYRVTVGLDVFQAAAAEIHFALPARGADAARRLVLRVTRDGGAVLGTRDGDRGAFRAAGAPVPFPPAARFADRGRYLEVQLERTDGGWTAWFNRSAAGRVSDVGTPEATEIRLYAEDGRARVDSVVLEQLVPAGR